MKSTQSQSYQNQFLFPSDDEAFRNQQLKIQQKYIQVVQAKLVSKQNQIQENKKIMHQQNQTIKELKNDLLSVQAIVKTKDSMILGLQKTYSSISGQHLQLTKKYQEQITFKSNWNINSSSCFVEKNFLKNLQSNERNNQKYNQRYNNERSNQRGKYNRNQYQRINQKQFSQIGTQTQKQSNQSSFVLIWQSDPWRNYYQEALDQNSQERLLNEQTVLNGESSFRRRLQNNSLSKFQKSNSFHIVPHIQLQIQSQQLKQLRIKNDQLTQQIKQLQIQSQKLSIELNTYKQRQKQSIKLLKNSIDHFTINEIKNKAIRKDNAGLQNQIDKQKIGQKGQNKENQKKDLEQNFDFQQIIKVYNDMFKVWFQKYQNYELFQQLIESFISVQNCGPQYSKYLQNLQQQIHPSKIKGQEKLGQIVQLQRLNYETKYEDLSILQKQFHQYLVEYHKEQLKKQPQNNFKCILSQEEHLKTFQQFHFKCFKLNKEFVELKRMIDVQNIRNQNLQVEIHARRKVQDQEKLTTLSMIESLKKHINGNYTNNNSNYHKQQSVHIGLTNKNNQLLSTSFSDNKSQQYQFKARAQYQSNSPKPYQNKHKSMSYINQQNKSPQLNLRCSLNYIPQKVENKATVEQNEQQRKVEQKQKIPHKRQLQKTNFTSKVSLQEQFAPSEQIYAKHEPQQFKQSN